MVIIILNLYINNEKNYSPKSYLIIILEEKTIQKQYITKMTIDGVLYGKQPAGIEKIKEKVKVICEKPLNRKLRETKFLDLKA